jgi:hypothetical protein
MLSSQCTGLLQLLPGWAVVGLASPGLPASQTGPALAPPQCFTKQRPQKACAPAGAWPHLEGRAHVLRAHQRLQLLAVHCVVHLRGTTRAGRAVWARGAEAPAPALQAASERSKHHPAACVLQVRPPPSSGGACCQALPPTPSCVHKPPRIQQPHPDFCNDTTSPRQTGSSTTWRQRCAAATPPPSAPRLPPTTPPR